MTRVDPALLRILGLSDDDHLQPLFHDPRPDLAEGQAFVDTSSSVPLSPQGPAAFTAIETNLLPLRIERWDPLPSVFIVEGTRDLQVRSGRVYILDDDVIEVHSEPGRAVLVHETDQGGVVIDLDAGTVQIYRLPAPPTTHLEKLPEAAIESPEVLAPPDIDQLLDGLCADEWLDSMARALAGRTNSLDRAASAGLIVRLWHPTTADDRQRVMQNMRRGQLPPPIASARAWVASQSPGAVAHVVSQGQDEASRLVDGLVDLTQQLTDDRPAAAAVARDLVLRRDRLESVCRLLGIIDHDRDLRPNLTDIDASFTVHLATVTDVLDPIEDFNSGWLSAVAWQEPDCWWGALWPDSA